MLALQDLSVGYESLGAHRAVATNISVGITEGEFICLLGPNGVGKSTLMRTIAGIQQPLTGKVLLDGRDTRLMPSRERSTKMSVVLTERITAGLLSSYALISLGRYPHTGWFGKLTDADRRIVAEAIELAGAQDLVDRFVSELSDGERQRVMLARALAQQPQLMILDEITAFLDLPRRIEIMARLAQVARESGCAILMSTHDLDLALRNADMIWLMNDDGSIRTGAPEDLVLNGALADAFSGYGLEFDPFHAAFRIQNPSGSVVHVMGSDPIYREWTLNALRRKGFLAQATSSKQPGESPCVSIVEKGEWRLESGSGDFSFNSIAELVQHLVTEDIGVSEQ